MYKYDFITDAECNLLSVRSGTDSLLPSGNTRSRTPYGSRKPIGIKKQADVSFVYGEAAFPSWVWEVGFTESYIDLLEDARQWLEKSAGRVRLVTIVKLEEGKPAGISEEDLPVEEEEGTWEEEDMSEEEEQGTGQFGSDPASYDDLRTTCKADDWVEPITGFLEMWRYDKASGKMKQDGERIVCPSIPNCGTLPADTKRTRPSSQPLSTVSAVSARSR